MTAMTSPQGFSLLADIGGTNTRVALARGPKVLPDSIRRFKNADHKGLEPILTRYLAEQDHPVCTGGAVDLAGPVRNGVGTLTNLDWVIDAPSLTRASGAQQVAILNDMQAQGHAIGNIEAANLKPVLTTATTEDTGTKLVINVGTGFNAAPVYDTPQGRSVAASECGHANMPIRSESELRLMKFVETAHGFPAIEDVLSGRGLERVYAWIGHEENDPKDKPAAEIVASCLAQDDPRAEAAGRRFTRLLGTVSGNLSLIHLPFGGVYLVGGVACAFLPLLEDYGFGQTFRDKGRFGEFMENFSVTLVTDDYAALAGLARHLAETR